MDKDTLLQLQEQAVQAALKSGQIDDLDKAANISKQVAEVQKVLSDKTNQPKLARYEELKTWAALVVPFLSIATLAVTIYIQVSQLRATQEATEDTRWRETVKDVLSQMSKPASRVGDPALALSLLDPYAENDRFKKEATLLSVEILSRVPSDDRFKDYFLSHHLGESVSEVPFLTNLDRELYNNLAEADLQLKGPSPPPILAPARDALVGDIEFVSGKLCALYRAGSKSASPPDFRDAFLLNADLSGVDLTGADLTGAKLQAVNLTDATLGGDIKPKQTYFVDTHWWEARVISKPLLRFLVENNYPYFDNENVSYAAAPPDRNKYISLVQSLCRNQGMVCEPKNLKYGDPPPSKPQELGVSGTANGSGHN